MAGDWIKMRNDLSDDPAVIGVAARLGLDEFSVVGRLHRLWSWADRQSRDGHAAGVTSAWLDRYIQCDGFAQALIDVGWLIADESGITVPHFDRHNGESAKTRLLANERKQRQRTKSETVIGDVSRTSRDKSVTREEKRREESSSLRSEDEARVTALTVSGLVADGLTEQTAAEWLAHRKRLKAPLTPRAWDGIKQQAASAGWGIERAVLKALERGWRSFDAEWVGRGESNQRQRSPSWSEQQAAQMDALTGRNRSQDVPQITHSEVIDV